MPLIRDDQHIITDVQVAVVRDAAKRIAKNNPNIYLSLLLYALVEACREFGINDEDIRRHVMDAFDNAEGGYFQ